MAETNIGWADKNLNFLKWFCTKVSPGCKNCYMMAMAKQYPQHAAEGIVWRPNVTKDFKMLKAGDHVFVNTMSDTFHKDVPLHYIDRMWEHFAARPDVIFMLLTKRPERAAALDLEWLPNIWMGTSVESKFYTERLDVLRSIPARVRFVSFEPLLGSLRGVSLHDIQWAIVGGESGAGRRAMDKLWAEELLDAARLSGTAFYYKQGNGHKPGQDRLLRGQTWDEFPDQEQQR